MSDSLTPVWFITGCSTGIGRVLAHEVLKAGHRVVLTARKPVSVADLAAQYPDAALALALDVNDATQIAAAVQAAEARFGAIDVLVNNAGYGLEGAVEELTLEQIRHQFDTNFFGLIAVTQAILPGMRARKRGHIFNVASMAGLIGYRGVAVYCASKFAVVGLSEGWAQELAPFGLQVSIVEPGPYRTDWAGRSLAKSAALQNQDASSPYAALNQALDTMMSNADGKQPGDPLQIAQVLISAALQPTAPVHMLFGDEAIGGWRKKLDRLQQPEFFGTFPHARRAL